MLIPVFEVVFINVEGKVVLVPSKIRNTRLNLDSNQFTTRFSIFANYLYVTVNTKIPDELFSPKPFHLNCDDPFDCIYSNAFFRTEGPLPQVAAP